MMQDKGFLWAATKLLMTYSTSNHCHFYDRRQGTLNPHNAALLNESAGETFDVLPVKVGSGFVQG